MLNHLSFFESSVGRNIPVLHRESCESEFSILFLAEKKDNNKLCPVCREQMRWGMQLAWEETGWCSAASAAAGPNSAARCGRLQEQAINLKRPIINNRAAVTCSESPFLTAATSCCSANTVIDISCTRVSTGHYIQHIPWCEAAKYAQFVPVKFNKTPLLICA